MTNAVKFTKRGCVEVIVEHLPAGFQVLIVDSGAGINEDDLGRAFDEFSQFDYPGKHKPVGFGMGLAIVAAMVDAVDATLVVSSKPNTGTAFTLYVPHLKNDMA